MNDGERIWNRERMNGLKNNGHQISGNTWHFNG